MTAALRPSAIRSAASSLLLAAAAALALAGLGIASYLAVVHYADQPIVCARIGDCEYVNSSSYATLAGVPVAVIGAVAYATMLALVAVAWLRRSPEALVAAWGVALASFAFSMYLTYIELRVLEAICVYCVASASVMTALFVVLSIVAWLSRAPNDDERGDTNFTDGRLVSGM
jgi:uncharacterized membrane protein